VKLVLPELSLVIMVGTSGSGKSTFCRRHFKGTEVLSSDFCRGLVCDDENSMEATKDAFEVLHYIASKRLAAGKLTVIDATNVQPEARKPLLELARKYHCIPAAIVLDVPEKICQARNKANPDRGFGEHVIRKQRMDLKRSLRGLKREGFRYIYNLGSPEEIEASEVERVRLWTNLRNETGPFDIIGDVHGCFEELETLLTRLGYRIGRTRTEDGGRKYSVDAPPGRKAVFLGDLIDRGPGITEVLALVMDMVQAGNALCVPGNHEVKLLKKLRGKEIRVSHGLQMTLDQLENETPEFKDRVAAFIDSRISHYVLDEGRLVVAHAGMREEMQGRGSGRVRSFALYGETTGETDEFGLPVRFNWASEYRGKATVVYGHTPVPEVEWLNRTICIDTGCVFGGKLTALRYPEKEIISVPALRVYCDPIRPLVAEPASSGSGPAAGMSSQQAHDDLLDMEDVLGKRIIATRLSSTVTIREENAMAALESMSRWAANPKWLIYLPPTMSPSETSDEDGFLEHPREAFEYFRKQGVAKVVCEEKHMGSRAVVVICKDAEAARRRFGIAEGGFGIIYTRMGRRFFDSDPEMEHLLLERLRAALDASGFWSGFGTDWVCLDCELMPWSAKAQELLKQQYAAVGSASRAALAGVAASLEHASHRALPVGELSESNRTRREDAGKFVQTYRGYCWSVASVADLKLAPFHILATEGKVHSDKDHVWHMSTLAEVCSRDPQVLRATNFKVVDLAAEDSVKEGIDWWLELTGRGGEGMVVKPFDFILTGKKGLAQPAVKCRGREYLRIIYGPEYTRPEHLVRLRERGLSSKRSLAIREFALGMEALERFVRGEPLRKVHECVFGVLALESEPVDPRL
jgi:protein phosphatase